MFGTSNPHRKQGKQIVGASTKSNFSIGQTYLPVHEYEKDSGGFRTQLKIGVQVGKETTQTRNSNKN
jgi:hypothetical protein